MRSFLKEIFSNNYNDNQESNLQKRLQISTTALFIEIAKADNSFSANEMGRITDIIKKMFNLSDNQVQELIDLAEKQIVKSVSLYEFTDILNHEFDQDKKFEMVKRMWQIVYADNVLNKYEEHIMRIISNNLNISHRDMIAAKIEAKQSNSQ